MKLRNTLWLFALLSGGQNIIAQNYSFPLKREDFSSSERVSTGNHTKGIQAEGKDIGVRRYLGDRKWSFTKNGTDGTKNSDYLIYEKPVYAMDDGTIIGCWCNTPENPKPGEKHAKFLSKEMPGGGNMLWIEHADGTRALYAHMIPGSIDKKLCSNQDQFFPKPLAKGEHEDMYVMLYKDKQVTVKKGQFLGKAGNSGSSSAPHLHIHMEKSGSAAVMKFEQFQYKPMVQDDTDLTSQWKSIVNDEIPDGAVLITPPRKINYRMIDFECYWDGKKQMYAGIFKPGNDKRAAYFKDNWNDFLKEWKNLEAKGYRMIDFESYRDGKKQMYAGIFEPGNDKRAAYFKDNWNDFLKEWKNLEAKGYRMIDFESYQDGKKQMYAGIFKPGNDKRAAYFKDNWNDFLKEWKNLEAKGYRMIDFESYQDGKKQMYAGIFEPGNDKRAAYFKDNWNDFLKEWKNLEDKGYRMIDFESYRDGKKQMYAGIFEPGNYAKAAFFTDNWDDFLSNWKNLEE